VQKKIDLKSKDNLTIKEVAGEAFAILGNTGIIEPGQNNLVLSAVSHLKPLLIL
jgi:hypothetical protein